MRPAGACARWLTLGTLALVLAVFAAQLWHAARSDGLTIDEGIYIPVGLHHLRAADFSPNYETPPLSKLLCALPLLAREVPLPRRLPGESDAGWMQRTLFGARDAGTLIAQARLPAVLISLLVAGGLWAWARAAHGAAAGWIALGLCVFHTSLLAHGHLATTDLPAAAAMLAASAAFWRWSRRPGAGRASLVGLTLGLAAATRLTTLVLVPCFALWLVGRAWGAAPAERRTQARQALLAALLATLAAWGVLWSAYGWRYTAAPDGAPLTLLAAPRTALNAWIDPLEQARLLPQAYLAGVRFQSEHERRGHPAYFMGERSRRGWRSYFAVAFLVKNTPGFVLATLAVLGALAWRRPAWDTVETHWLLPVLATFAGVSLGHVQIGERYLLPIYPYLILLIAARAPGLLTHRRGRALALALAALHVVPALRAAPGGYLAYFNVLAGGTAGAHRVLLDSNLDWGQDLPRLARWMRERGVEQVQLAYMGADVPERFGIRHRDLPGRHLCTARPARRPWRGTLVLSPNLLFELLARPGPSPYAWLAARAPDERAGIFFVYRLGGEASGPRSNTDASPSS